MDIGFYRYSLLNRGGDRMVIEYANHLASLGNQVTMHVTRLDTVLTMHPEVAIRKVPWPGMVGFLAYALFKKLPHDLVIVDIIHLPLLLGVRNRVLYFAQADDVEYYEEAWARKTMDLLYRLHLRPGIPVITVDSHLSRIFAARYPGCRCYTVTNGIDLQTFFPEPAPDLLALKGDRKALLFLARGDHFRKGYDLALEVFRDLEKGESQELELWVCGDRLEEAGGLTVRNFGVVDDARLRQILSSADIFFYPSRHEGFGLFPLEAMACGCAVVTTEAVPYAKSLSCISTAPIGDIAGMRREIEYLVGEPARLDEKKRQGISAASGYDLEQSKDAFAQAVRSILEEVPA